MIVKRKTAHPEFKSVFGLYMPFDLVYKYLSLKMFTNKGMLTPGPKTQFAQKDSRPIYTIARMQSLLARSVFSFIVYNMGV